MVSSDNPYEYGGEVPDAGLDGDDPTDEASTVIVDGSAMTFRSYRRHDRE